MAKTLKAGDVQHARHIQTRLAAVDLPPKMMNAALKRFAAFESEHGDAASAAAVKGLGEGVRRAAEGRHGRGFRLGLCNLRDCRLASPLARGAAGKSPNTPHHRVNTPC